ncbi:MAG: hypothetical protein DMF61_03275 [Blastocatellia bacterium AA13]|nr:MAG: hypothetical protein DMF61_03275 [Blastocatellia bacterium AA13]
MKYRRPFPIAIILSTTILVCQVCSPATGAASSIKSEIKSDREIVLQQEKKSSDQDSLRLSATLVQAPAIVTDKQGKFITDLVKGDFSIFEDGKRQEIASFASIQQPFNVVLVLDTSNSAEERLKAIQETAIRFVKRMQKDDRAMVISFDNEVRQLTDFTSDSAELESSIRRTESGFGKLFYEAIAKALDSLKSVEGRRAVIIFSDGIDMKSIEASFEGTIKQAEETGAAVYAIMFDTRWWIEATARKLKAEHPDKPQISIDGRIPLPPDMGGPDGTSKEFPHPKMPRIEVGSPSGPPLTFPDSTSSRQPSVPADEITQNLDKMYGEADQYLKSISAKTGGRFFKAEDFADSRAAFDAITDELRNQYLIGYYTTRRHDSKYHKIKVETSRKNVLIRSRQGYRDSSEK